MLLWRWQTRFRGDRSHMRSNRAMIQCRWRRCWMRCSTTCFLRPAISLKVLFEIKIHILFKILELRPSVLICTQLFWPVQPLRAERICVWVWLILLLTVGQYCTDVNANILPSISAKTVLHSSGNDANDTNEDPPPAKTIPTAAKFEPQNDTIPTLLSVNPLSE